MMSSRVSAIGHVVQLREWFRGRTARPPRALADPAAAYNDPYAHTEWAATEWPDTCPAAQDVPAAASRQRR